MADQKDASAIVVEPMDEERFQEVVRRLIDDAKNYMEQDHQDFQEKSWKYYGGESDLVPREGRSKFVMFELRDTVESIMPTIIKVFAGKSPPVCFKAKRGPQDAPMARQQTQYVNHIYSHDNDGFKNTYWFGKNALLTRIGAFETGKSKKYSYCEEEYEGLSEQQLLVLAEEDGVEILEMEINADDADLSQINGEIPPGVTYDIRISRTTEGDDFFVRVIPPENLIINVEAESAEDAIIIGEYSDEYVTDLVAMGYDVEDILPYSFIGENSGDNREAVKDARTGDEHQADTVSGDPALRKVETYKIFVKVDADGDGIAELHKVIAIGQGKHILDSEIVDRHGITISSPYLTPHDAIGGSLSDLMFDLQDLLTQLSRQVLDGIVLSTTPTRYYVEGMVDVEAMKAMLYDGLVPMKSRNAVEHQNHPFNAAQALPIIEWGQERKELRTGTNKISQGLDPDALQSSSEMGVQALLTAAQDKILLVARVLAETGFKPMFKGLLKDTIQYQDKARMIEITGEEWVPMDPRTWHSDVYVKTNVGLGNGSEVQKIAALQDTHAKQSGILSSMGPRNPYVTPGQAVKAVYDLAELQGISPSEYWNTPEQADMIAQQMMQEQAQQPSPEQMEMQLEQEKHQQKMQQEREKSQGQMALKAQQAQTDAILEKQKNEQQLALEAKKTQSSMLLQAQGQQAEQKLEIEKAREEARLARWKARSDQALKRQELRDQVRLRAVELAAEAALEREKMLTEQRSNRSVGDLNLRRPEI